MKPCMRHRLNDRTDKLYRTVRCFWHSKRQQALPDAYVKGPHSANPASLNRRCDRSLAGLVLKQGLDVAKLAKSLGLKPTGETTGLQLRF